MLCSGKRQSLYKIILQDLRNKACSVTALPLVAKRMHCDYDIAAMNAFLEVFGDVQSKVVGCGFHLSQVDRNVINL